MAAQVGFAGLKVTGGSYGWFLWFLWFGLRMAARVGFPRPHSYGRFLWMVPMVPMVAWAADGCPVGVTDRMSVHVLDEEQLAPLRVR